MNVKEKIFICDDEDINITILRGLLENIYDINSTNDSRKSFDMIKEYKPELILLDVKMPYVDGFEICKNLKNDTDTKNIPIIFITAVMDEEDIEKAFTYGGLDYVIKPFRSKELLARIKTQLKVSGIQKDLEKLASTDYMTKLYNRRHFFIISSHLIDLAKREDKDIGIVMVDIDKFKNINDTYGHEVGDNVIISMANKLIGSQRKSDITCRYGGEEFVVLLANTTLNGAKVFANKIRKDIENMCLNINNHKIKFTISLGVSIVYAKNEVTAYEAINRADIALYEAKETGRNKVCTKI